MLFWNLIIQSSGATSQFSPLQPQSAIDLGLARTLWPAMRTSVVIPKMDSFILQKNADLKYNHNPILITKSSTQLLFFIF